MSSRSASRGSSAAASACTSRRGRRHWRWWTSRRSGVSARASSRTIPRAPSPATHAVRADARRRHRLSRRHGRARSPTRGGCRTGPASTAICSTTATSSTAARSWTTWAASRRGRASRAARCSRSTGSGRVLWEVRHPDHHHDARRLRNGNVLLLCLAPLPANIAGQVRGGLPGTEADGKIYADYLVEMTTQGDVVLGVAKLGASRSRRLSGHACRIGAPSGPTATRSPRPPTATSS